MPVEPYKPSVMAVFKVQEGDKASLYKDYDWALFCYDMAIKDDCRYADAWHGKGVVFNDLKQYDEAIECFDKAIELNPTDAKPWFFKGTILEKKEKYSEAIKCYDNVIKLDPSHRSVKERRKNIITKVLK